MDHIKYWQEHGKTELSHTAGGNVKSYNNFLSSLLPRFFKFYVPCDSVILLFGIWSRELLPCKHLCANFHRNFTCNSQRLEAVHMPSHPWMDKTNCGIHEMLFSQKEHTFDKLQIYLLVNLALIFFWKERDHVWKCTVIYCDGYSIEDRLGDTLWPRLSRHLQWRLTEVVRPTLNVDSTILRPGSWIEQKGGKDIISAFLALSFPTVDTMC